MFVVGLVTGPLAHDFKNELYPQAEDTARRPEPLAGGDLAAAGAAVVAMPFTILPPTAADVAFGLVGLACMARGALARRRARLARLRRGRPLAVGARRHPHRPPDAAPLPARRASCGATRPAAARAGLGARDRQGREVLPLAPRRLAAGQRTRPGGGPRGGGRGRLRAARRAVRAARRLRRGRFATSAGSSTRTATRCSAS